MQPRKTKTKGIKSLRGLVRWWSRALGVKWFIEHAYGANYNAKKHGDMELISLDLAESWKICNQLHPMKFSAFDLVKDGDAMLEEKCGEAVDVLLSLTS